MESKHESQSPTSPSTYTETYRGFTLTLERRPRPHQCHPDDGTPTGRCIACLQGEVRGVAREAVTWVTPWGIGWARQLAEVRRLVDRYVDTREACGRLTAERNRRRELAAGAGAIELSPRFPAVRS